MSIQISRLVKDTVTYSLGALLNRVLMFLLLPLFTRLLTPNDYGVNAVIGTLLVGLSGFFGLGTGTSLGVLYFELREESARSTVIWTSVIFLTAHSLVLCGVAAVFATPLSQMFFQSPEYSDLIRMGLVTTGLLTASEPFFAFLRMEKKARLVVALSVVETVLGLALSVYLVAVMHRGLRGIFESALLVKGLMFVIALAVIGRRLPIRLDLKLVARLVRIGFPSVLGTGAFFVVDYLDRVMLQQMTSTGTVGVYSVGYNFGMVMLLAVGGFGSAWPPYFLSFIDRREEAQAIFGLWPDNLPASLAKWQRALAQRRIERLIITQGARPTLCLSAAGCLKVPALSVRPVDTVGAGDAFAGAFAARRAGGADLLSAIRYAN